MRLCGVVLALAPCSLRRRRRISGPDRARHAERAPRPCPRRRPPAWPASAAAPIFPADNAWNRDVSGDPVATNSAALLGVMSPGNAVHLDLGTTEEYYGIPYTSCRQTSRWSRSTYGTDGADYSDESDPGPMPIPLDVAIEGGSTADPNPGVGDRHVLVVQQGALRALRALQHGANRQRLPGQLVGPVGPQASTRPGRRAGRRPTRPGLPILPGLLRAQRSRRGPHHPRAAVHRAACPPGLRRAGQPLRPVRATPRFRRTAPARGSRPISRSRPTAATRW